MKTKGKTAYKNFTITIPFDLAIGLKQRAEEADLTVSAYLRRLIKSDLITLKET
jgi:hypothetical protein